MTQRIGYEIGGVVESKESSFHYTPRMLVLYFALAFAITWAILIPALASVPEDRQIFFIIPAAFGPFLSAVVTIWTGKGWTELRRWLRQIFKLRIPVILYLTGAFLLPIGVGVLHYGLYRVLGGEPAFSAAAPWYLYLLYLIPTALLTGGNEEPGWRGFALPTLLQWFHPLLAAVILGLIHAAWHLPLMRHYDTTFGWYLLNVVPLTFIFNWLYLKSRRSVIPVALFHAGTNVIGDFFPTPVDVLGGLGTDMFLRSSVYWGIAIILIVATRGRLGCDSTDGRLLLGNGKGAASGDVAPMPVVESHLVEEGQ
jgi:membrane protease YdiL (CAAX protease family)